MAVPKRKQLILGISSVLKVCSFLYFPGIHGNVPYGAVYTELHKDVRIGDRAVLTCQFRGSPLAVYWKKGYDPRRSPNLVSWIPTDDVTGKCQRQRVCDIMEMNENHSLVIKVVGFAERGRYICRVANHIGEIIHNFTDVSLYAPPKEPYPVIDWCINDGSSVSNPEPCRVLTNKTITITCSVTNYYPKIELFYLHGTTEITTINREEQTNADSTKNVSISIEAGPSETLYTCVASDVPGLTERKAATILVESIPSPTTETIKKQSQAVMIVALLLFLLILAVGTAGVLLWRKLSRQTINEGNEGNSDEGNEEIGRVTIHCYENKSYTDRSTSELQPADITANTDKNERQVEEYRTEPAGRTVFGTEVATLDDTISSPISADTESYTVRRRATDSTMQETLTAEKLIKVAEAVAVDKNLLILGLKLGFTEPNVKMYISTNKRNDSFEGTSSMLFDWKRKTPRAQQIPDLIKALNESGFGELADDFFQSGHVGGVVTQ